MSKRPVRCPSCKTEILVEQHKTSRSKLNHGVDRVGYVPDGRSVIIICPSCGNRARWPGKRILIVDAA